MSPTSSKASVSAPVHQGSTWTSQDTVKLIAPAILSALGAFIAVYAQVSVLESRISDLKLEVAGLREELRTANGKIDELGKNVERALTMIQGQQREIDKLDDRLRDVERASNSPEPPN